MTEGSVLCRVGSIVKFRNRDWVRLPNAEEDVILLRPLTGTSDDVVAVHKRLSGLLGYTFPTERITPSEFPPPSVESVADAQSLHLLWQAARLMLREGAAPLRSLGRISFRPRTYQLVPLMMALRLDPVRLLIADDVGVGKTIEAGLVVREMWERGVVRRVAVLCPPYLCDQWQRELVEKFHLDAVVVNSATIGHLERHTPQGLSVYEHYPVQVISIDFVKYPHNKPPFLLHAPEIIIVDEAHGSTPGRGTERHLRYELVSELAKDRRRHLILLTATPHSGIADAFKKLLGLLDPEFETWDLSCLDEAKLRRLALHFVQRTRKDIEHQWEDMPCFPKREVMDYTYQLSQAYWRFFEAVYDFCTEIVESGRLLQAHRRRMRWWSALALLRCVMSSPRAAQIALKKPKKGEVQADDDEEGDISQVFEPDDRLPSEDPPTHLFHRAEAHLSDPEKRRLRELERMAERIHEDEDRKLQACIALVQTLLKDGFNPIVWCYYVDTAEYVAEKLEQALCNETCQAKVLCITGRLGEEERRLKVEAFMKEPGRRVLVATDCLSEGVNLQTGFNAVIHYDLPWNPNRLEQREGRVDRYGQPSSVVRAIRFYGRDNPVDGAVIRVLLDKAREIRLVLGTHVPVPEEEKFVVEALVHALFFSKHGLKTQLLLDLEPDPVPAMHKRWDLDAKREKENRTRFAQRALKPEEVQRELEAADQVLGDPKAVSNFVLVACQKIGLEVRQSRGDKEVWEVVTERSALEGVPEAIKRALPCQGKSWKVTFVSPSPEEAEYLGRNHPFVATLARYLFEQAFSGSPEALTARCGAIRTKAVERLTALMLLRPRYKVMEIPRSLLAEEVIVVGWEVYKDRFFGPKDALPLMVAEPYANLPLAEKRELVTIALEEARRLLEDSESEHWLRKILKERAEELQEAYKRVRRSIGESVRGLEVELHWPPDLLGILVLQPVAEGAP